MDFAQFHQMASAIVKANDCELRRQATQQYFAFMRQYPAVYVQHMTQLFAGQELDLIAFYATVMRKHISQQASESFLATCPQFSLIEQLVNQLLVCLAHAVGYSHILADLIGEIAIFMLRNGGDISHIGDFLAAHIDDSLQYEVSIIVWQMSSVQWSLIQGFIMKFIAHLCKSPNIRVMSQMTLTLCNLLCMQLYTPYEADCISFELQQELISEVIQIISRMCPTAYQNIALFRTAMDQFIELFDCAAELFTDHLQAIEQLSNALILYFQNCFALQSIGFSLFITFLSYMQDFGVDTAKYPGFIELLVGHLFPLLNVLSAADIENFHNNESLDINSQNYEAYFYVQQILYQQFEEIGFPACQSYLQSRINDSESCIGCIILIGLLLQSGGLKEYGMHMSYLLYQIKNSAKIHRYLVLNVVQNSVSCIRQYSLFRDLVMSLIEVFPSMQAEELFVYVQFLKCFLSLNEGAHKIYHAQQIAQIALHYYNSQIPQAQQFSIRLIGLLVYEYPEAVALIQPFAQQIVLTYLQTVAYFAELRHLYAYQQLLEAYLLEIVDICSKLYVNSESVVYSIFDLIGRYGTDQLFSFMEAIIIAVSRITKTFSQQLSALYLELFFKLALEILQTPIFSTPNEASFEETSVCNSFVINTKQLVFSSMSNVFWTVPERATQYASVVAQVVEGFDYTKYYYFINICQLYVAICAANGEYLQRVLGIFDSAINGVRRTVFEMENLFAAFDMMLSLKLADKQIVLHKIMCYIKALFTTVSKQTQKYLCYFDESGRQSDNSSEYLRLVYTNGKLATLLLSRMIDESDELLLQLCDYLRQQTEDFLFVGCILQAILRRGYDISTFLPIVLGQVGLQHHVDADYFLLIQLSFAGAFELTYDQFHYLYQKYLYNPSYGCALLCFYHAASHYCQFIAELAKRLATEFEQSFENAEFVIYQQVFTKTPEAAFLLQEGCVISRVLQAWRHFEGQPNQQLRYFAMTVHEMAPEHLRFEGFQHY